MDDIGVRRPPPLLDEFPAWNVDDRDEGDPDTSAPFHTRPEGEGFGWSIDSSDTASCGPDGTMLDWLEPGALDLSGLAGIGRGGELWVVTTLRFEDGGMERSALGPFDASDVSVDVVASIPASVVTLSARIVSRRGELIEGILSLPRLVQTDTGFVRESDLELPTVTLADGVTYVSIDR